MLKNMIGCLDQNYELNITFIYALQAKTLNHTAN